MLLKEHTEIASDVTVGDISSYRSSVRCATRFYKPLRICTNVVEVLRINDCFRDNTNALL